MLVFISYNVIHELEGNTFFVKTRGRIGVGTGSTGLFQNLFSFLNVGWVFCRNSVQDSVKDTLDSKNHIVDGQLVDRLSLRETGGNTVTWMNPYNLENWFRTAIYFQNQSFVGISLLWIVYIFTFCIILFPLVLWIWSLSLSVGAV